MSQLSLLRDTEVPSAAAVTDDMFQSPEPMSQSPAGPIYHPPTSFRNQSSQQQNTWMDSRLGMSEAHAVYEDDPDMWSQSDDTSLTGGDDSLSDQDLDQQQTDAQKISKHEHLRILALRKHIDSLASRVVEKELLVQTTREELNKCRTTIEVLELEQEHVFNQIQESVDEGNTANVYRLEKKHIKICQELEAERGLEMKIEERLAHSELELSKADLERGRFLLAEEELKQREEKLDLEKGQNAALRARKEIQRARRAEKRQKDRERDHIAAIKERERIQRQALSAAKRSKEHASKYLAETLAKVKQQKIAEEERVKTHVDQRVHTLLTLKNDVTTNRENLKALQARNKFLERKAKEAEENERRELEEAGKNVEEMMLKKKRLQEFEDQKRKYFTDQRQKQSQLLSHLLEEEREMKKRQKMYPQLFPDPERDKSMRVKTPPKKPVKLLKDLSPSPRDPDVDLNEDRLHTQVEVSRLDEASSDEEEHYTPYGLASHSNEEDGMREGKVDEELAKPEFEGLWNKAHRPYKVPKEEKTLNYPSKMEKEIMDKALEKHRAGIVRKQVAAGREFTGRPFVSKPDIIHFKDFEVGKSYKKKIVLTNVSYSVNFLKLLDLSEHLKDFVDLQFDPPGQMSAGMSCDMLVTFKPVINEDLFGEVKFLAQTGPFSVSVQCTTKKCDVSVDTDFLDFGIQVIGETLKKTFILSNKGAKGTDFEFIKITGMKQPTIMSVGTSLGRMTTAEESVKPETFFEEEEAAGRGKLKKKQAKAKRKSGAKKSVKEEKPKTTEEELPVETTPTPGDPPMEEVPAEEDHDPVEVTIEEQDLENEEDQDEEEEEDADDYGGLDGMSIFGPFEGQLGPFGSIKLEIIYQPRVPGQVDVDFEIRFSDEDSEMIPIKCFANAIDVPVWVERQNVDLKICMFDRLYQDAIVVNNRATTALRITFEVCKELRNHLELLPKTAYIQAQSQFSAQMKFLPRHTLIEEAKECFDPETGVLEVPMVIKVADQTAPVLYTVHAVITSSDLEFDLTNLDFGCCTIHESVIYSVRLTNKSILSQKFGFVELPEFVDVQPNDGFGTLLPLETIELDIIFSAEKAKEYNFDLTCKSGINRNFKLSCKAVGVHPPLELSHSVIHFAATAMEDSSVASFYIINNHTDANEFTHPVPRVGKDEVVPVGPTSFEFVIPTDAPLSIFPSVGTIKPGKKTCISVKFNPHLQDEDIRKEAVNLAVRNLEAKARQKFEEAQLQIKKNATDSGEKNKKAGKKPKSPGSKGKHSPVAGGPALVTPPNPENILQESDDYAAGRSSLLRQFPGQFQSFFIPCFVAPGLPGDPGTLPYRVENTLFLDVHCPAVRPSVVVISNQGRPSTDFGEVSIGQRVVKSVTIQNISGKYLNIQQSVLDCHGPFLVLNAIRDLEPDATHTLVVAFEPLNAKVYYEVLEVQCAASTLSIVLQGQGLQPEVKVSVTDGLLDLGYILAGEEHVETFQLENSSTFSIDYKIKFDSLSSHKYEKQAELPAVVRQSESTMLRVGPANFNGKNVFDCKPCEGTIEPGKKVEVAVTFRPDHPSELFADVARIELFGKQEGYVLHLTGAAKTKIMYIQGADEIRPDVESLAVTPELEDEDAEAKAQAIIPALLTFRALSKDERTEPAVRTIHVGCVRTSAVSQKKNGEFFFDNLNAMNAYGFQVDPIKGMVEAGMTKNVQFTWSPPKGHDPNLPIEANIILNLKGDALERYNLLLRAQVITKEQDPLP